MKKKSPSNSAFFVARVLVAVGLCSAGAALGMLSFATPEASRSTMAAAVPRVSVPLLLAQQDRRQADLDAYSVINFQRLISVSEWFSSTGPFAGIKRGLLRKSPSAPRSGAPASRALTPFVSDSVTPTVSPLVRDLPAVSPFTLSTGQREEGELSNRSPQLPRDPLEHDPVIQSTAAPTVGMPGVGVSFEGMNISQACGSCLPPDTIGAVGPNHYVQMVNEHFAIYSKTGALLSGPKAINSLWAATPNSICATHNNGDPIVIYDQLADRWLLSQFTVQSGTENYAECIAISQTPDPTGAYWLYQFDESADTFHDYPHLGIWPDGYYMSTNLFPNSALLFSTGAGAWAFERPKMLLGQAARYVYFDETPLATNTYTPGGQLPASLDGKIPPPAGAPNYFAEVNNANQPNTPPATGLHDEMHIWKFHVDWTNPANSTFGMGSSAPAPKPGFPGQYAGNAGQPNFIIPIADFVPSACQIENGPNDCVPQKQTSGQPPQYLDILGDRLMYRLAYRNFGDHESLVVNHSVDAAVDQPMGVARTGVRWYEVRNLSATPAVYQQGTFAPLDPTSPDGPLWRWMGSAAMDHNGDLAIGYSASGPNYFPSLHYAGRLAGDPLNELTQGEAVMFAGQGIEANTGIFPFRNRWGDYSNLTMDPTDDCTFWYTNEYLVSTPTDILPVDWHTRIGSFKFPTCVATPVQVVGAVSRKTHGSAGTFEIDLPLTGGPGIECRSGGPSNNHTVVVTFATPVTVGSANCDGTPVTPSINGSEVSVTCSLANEQTHTINLLGVSSGSQPADVAVPISVLLGDTTANGAVNSSDIAQTQSQSGQTVTTSNFREDVTVNGAINSSDIALVQSKSGTALP